MPEGPLYQAITEACADTTSRTLALSGGLDSTIIAYMIRGRRPAAITVAASDFAAPDLEHARLVSKSMDMPLSVVRPAAGQLLKGAAETVRILGNFNDIEIRNSLVVYLAIKKAGEDGARSIITGDGADELFAGYDFMLRSADLGAELRRLRRIMHYTSHQIGRSLGVEVESPFLDGRVMDAALGIPPSEMIGRRNGRRMGKMVLRRLFEGVLPEGAAWRPKSPMQDGAGTSAIAGLLDSATSDERFKSESVRIMREDGVRIRTRESLYYYNCYRKCFGAPAPGPDGGRNCPYCRHAVNSSRFCRMCGAFPI